MKEWFCGLAGRKSPGDTFNSLHLQQATLVQGIRQIALNAHRLDLTFDDAEATALIRYIDYRARSSINYANIIEALESLDENVRGDAQHLFSDHANIGRRKTYADADTALGAEEAVAEVR